MIRELKMEETLIRRAPDTTKLRKIHGERPEQILG